MKQISNFGDERQIAQCAYCGGSTRTRDHVPSRVLLDEPYPENLPVVPACIDCNEGFSKDEEYVACLLDCILSGDATPKRVQRDKVRQILLNKPALAARLAEARVERHGDTQFSIEDGRVRNLVMKLARGHALFELNEPHYEEPHKVWYMALPALSDNFRGRFESLDGPTVLPEVGSRAMQQLSTALARSVEWIIVQPGRYRYLACADEYVRIRMVLSEYLACEVIWL